MSNKWKANYLMEKHFDIDLLMKLQTSWIVNSETGEVLETHIGKKYEDLNDIEKFKIKQTVNFLESNSEDVK